MILEHILCIIGIGIWLGVIGYKIIQEFNLIK